jgi:hypothetical protein
LRLPAEEIGAVVADDELEITHIKPSPPTPWYVARGSCCTLGIESTVGEFDTPLALEAAGELEPPTGYTADSPNSH